MCRLEVEEAGRIAQNVGYLQLIYKIDR